MFCVGTDWNPKQTELKKIITKPDEIENTKKLLHELHSIVHSSEVYENSNSYYDEIIWNINQNNFSVMPISKSVTVAWNLWHITRIEDITTSIFILDKPQTFNSEWKKELNSSISDTGNAMTYDEIKEFSERLELKALLEYRNSVGKRTKELISQISTKDMKRKFTQSQIDRCLLEGCVTNQEDSIWLKDFWGKKTVAGIFLMPVTRHQIVHLNDCKKLIEKIIHRV